MIMSNNIEIKKTNTRSQQASNKSSNTAESVHTDDIMSSVSNPDVIGKKADNNQTNNLTIINMKRKNLNYHGAYLLCQRIKVFFIKEKNIIRILFISIKQDFSIIQTIDLSENQLEDEGILYMSIALRLCTKLNSLVIIIIFFAFNQIL